MIFNAVRAAERWAIDPAKNCQIPGNWLVPDRPKDPSV
jgi:hypothetical protein